MTALAIPAAASTRPGFGRLTAVELRKMTDTRAGFWLQAVVAGLTAVLVVLFAVFGDARDHNLRAFLEIAIQPAGVLLPVVGILLVSSEWSQRTTLITFTLVPRRTRLLGAKLAAGLVLAVIAFAVALVVAVIGNAAAGGEWTLSGGVGFQIAFYAATAMVTGVGFGAALLSSAPAIVLSFALPLAWSALGSLSFLEGAARWLDQSRALGPLTDHDLSAIQWAHAGSALALWMVLPVLIGLWRITRGDVRA